MKRLLRGTLIVLAIAIAGFVAFRLIIRVDRFKPSIETALSHALGRNVRVGNLSLAIFSGAVEANDLAISDDPGFAPTPFLKAKSLKVGVEMAALVFSHQIRITRLTIEKPEIALLRNPAGKWNFSSLGTSPAPAAPVTAGTPVQSAKPDFNLSVRLIEIRNGRVSLQGLVGNARPRVIEKLNADLKGFAAGSSMPFSLEGKIAGGGEIALKGKLGPINASDTAETPLECTVKINDLDLNRTGLLNDNSGLGAIASIDGNATSDGHALTASGRLILGKMRLAGGGAPVNRPVEMDFAVKHETGKQSGLLSRGDVHIGRAALTVTGAYDLTGNDPVVHFTVNGASIPMADLVAMLPALNVYPPEGSSIQGGTGHVRLNMDGPPNNLQTVGSVSAENVHLHGFNLGSKLSFMEKLAGLKAGLNTELHSIRADVRTIGHVTAVNNIDAIAVGIGELTGSGTIGAHNELDFRMRANLQTSGPLMTSVGAHGDTGVPFYIAGTAHHPVFKADLEKIVTKGAVKKVTNLVERFLGKKKN